MKGIMNYYELLNIEVTATSVEIKKAYRKMAMRWHPDRNNNSKESEEKFKLIKEAYETLSNDSARFWYDRDVLNNSQSTNKNYYKSEEDNTKKENDTKKEEPKSTNSNDESNFYKKQENNNDDLNQEKQSQHNTNNNETESKFNNQESHYDRYNFWREKYPFCNFHEYVFDVNEDFIILGGTKHFNYPWKNSFINIKISIRANFDLENILEVKITEQDILLIRLNIIVNPNKHLDIFSKIDLDIFSALHGIDIQLPTSSGTHNIKIPPLTKHGDNLTLYGLGLKGDFFVGNLYVKINVYYPEFFSDEQKFLLGKLSSIQREREKHIFSKIFNIFKESYYTIKPKKK